MTVHSGGQLFLVVGRTSSMGLDGIVEVGHRTSEGQVGGVCMTGYAAESLARIGGGGSGLKLFLTRSWKS